MIQRAICTCSPRGKKEVTGANVLVAIFGEKDSHAVYFLHQQGVTRLDVVNFISHGITKSAAAEAATSSEARGRRARTAARRNGALDDVHAEPQRAGASRARSIR